jgi:P27 family predicted phage terminase small subunit
MGKRGPKPKPTAVKERQGTLYAYRQKNEPTPEVEIPPKPSWVKGQAAKHWKQIAPVLVANGLLTKLDAIALSILCRDLGIAIDADERVARDGVIVESPRAGTEYQNPALGIANQAWKRVARMLTQFGMSPSARAGLAIDNAKADNDPLAILMAGMQQRN